MTLTSAPSIDELLLYLRVVVLVVWGIAGVIAFWNATREHGWGVAFLAFGAYLALGWLAVRP